MGLDKPTLDAIAAAGAAIEGAYLALQGRGAARQGPAPLVYAPNWGPSDPLADVGHAYALTQTDDPAESLPWALDILDDTHADLPDVIPGWGADPNADDTTVHALDAARTAVGVALSTMAG